MSTTKLFLYVLAVVLAILAGVGIAHPRANLGWFSLACFELAQIVSA